MDGGQFFIMKFWQIIIMGKGEPKHEYFCYNCGQLRLSFCDTTVKCGNCNSPLIKTGALNTLDKDKLLGEHNGKGRGKSTEVREDSL